MSSGLPRDSSSAGVRHASYAATRARAVGRLNRVDKVVCFPNTGKNGESGNVMGTFMSRLQPWSRGELWLRVFFWTFGLIVAAFQLWSERYYMTADAISYLDMSDAVLPRGSWSKLINGVWSPLYPFLLGVGRRLLQPSPIKEVVIAHYLNLAFLLWALLCFEFLMRSLLAEQERDMGTSRQFLPRWGCLGLGYPLFLWAAISQIRLETLRADMLMSGFVYLMIGLILRIRNEGPKWTLYMALGGFAGLGYLAKAAMFPFGVLILGSSLLLVRDWRRALVPAGAAAIVALAIGAAYFYPLSKLRGHFTLGESGHFNYLYHVDGAGPTWYIQDLGAGAGTLERVPRKIFSMPPTYEFSFPYAVTHPLRFDPSYWTQGARTRFRLRNQYAAMRENLHLLAPITGATSGVMVAFFVLLFTGEKVAAVFRQWPVWFSGMAGIAMYEIVHVEARYVGVFFVLLWLGLLVPLYSSRDFGNRLLTGLVIGVTLSLFIPLVETTAYDFSKAKHRRNDVSVQAALELRKLGLCEGALVARISPWVTDLMWARALRAMVVSEVDYEYTYQFWESNRDVRAQVLKLMASSGAKLVVADVPTNIIVPSGWQQLGNTSFWFHPLVERDIFACGTGRR